MAIRRTSAGSDRGRRTSRFRSAPFRRTFAVFAALLLVTSLLAGPAMAGRAMPDASGPAQPSLAEMLSAEDQHVQQQRVAPQPAPRTQLAAARAATREMEPPTNATELHRQRALAAFDRSVHGFVTGVDPGTRSTLENASEGVRELAESVGTTWDAKSSLSHLAAIGNASGTSVEAARVDARWEIAVANRTIRQHEANLTSAQLDRLGNELAQAETAYEDGRAHQNGTAETLNTTDRWQFKEGVYERGRAIGKYGEAWEKARGVVEIVDEEYDVEPDVGDADGDGLIDAREHVLGTDPNAADSDGDRLSDADETAGGFPVDTDGDGTIDALDRDSDGDAVRDVRPEERFDDADADAIPNVRDADDDGDGIPTATEVNDSQAGRLDADFDGTANWLDTDADGDGELDAEEGRVDEDGDGVPAYLDNDADDDRLPDFYEVNVTGTATDDNDSDYPGTDANESDDGVLDGVADVDGDSLSAHNEWVVGTDPLVADTDGDGLLDGFEAVSPGIDPLDADADGDGVPDAEEDLDGDGLATLAEYEHGTSVRQVDSDRDGIDDGREVELGTNATAVDTDEDGLPDAEELGLPTDPTDPDTDDDGVLDGDESFTTSTRNASLGASVELNGAGNVSAATTIGEPEHARFSEQHAPGNVTASGFVHVDVGTNFTSANVTLAYDESAVQTNESSLGVYRFNETAGAYERLPSTVDAANDTVTGTTTEFSTVVAMDGQAAVDRIRQRSRALDGVGIVDRTAAEFDFETSGPVTIPSGESRTVDGNEWHCDNVPRGGQYLDTPISGSCEVRDGSAIVREETNRERTLAHTLELPTVEDGRQLFVEASLEAEVDAQWSNSGIYINVTGEDGTHSVFRLSNDWSDTTERIEATPRVDVTEFAGQEVSIEFSADGRHTYESEDTMSSIEVHDLAFVRHGESDVDSDGDDVTDAWEERGVPLAGTVATTSTSPTDADSDGDGLQDGQEVDTEAFRQARAPSDADVLVFPGFQWHSDPGAVHTDSDGLDDQEETTSGTDPRTADTDGDGLDDAEDGRPTVARDRTDDDASIFSSEDGEHLPDDAFLEGMLLGDWGYVHDREGSRQPEYFVGWILPYLVTVVPQVAVPLEDAVELALEIRDCVAWNDAWWENALDCGYVGWEVGSTAAKAIGTVTALTGVGAVLAAGAVVADEIQDVAAAVTETVQALRKAPSSAVRPVGQQLARLFPSAGQTVASRLGDLDGSIVSSFRRGVDEGALMSTGLSRSVAEDVVSRVDDVSGARRVASRLDNLDEVPASVQSDLVVQLTRRGDADTLTSAYDAGTLRRIVAAGGGSGGDDLLDAAADAARAGKAGKVARLARELDPSTFGSILRRGQVDEASRLLEYGVTTDRIRQFTNNGRVAAALGRLDQNLQSIYQQNSDKFTDTLSPRDIDSVVYDRNGIPTMVLDTNKWVSGSTFDEVLAQGPGWRHVVARHVHPNAPGSWPVEKSGKVDDIDDVSTFPSDLGPEEVKEVIRITVRNGDVSGSEITYAGSKLDQYGIDKMRVIRGSDNGILVTSFPPK